MSEQKEKMTVWFVRDGHMHSSWVIGYMDINVAVAPSQEYTKPVEVAANIFTDGDPRVREHDGFFRSTTFHELVSRPGRWFYLSGMYVVHGDDLYGTREDAAEAYKNFLLNE